MLGNRKLKIVDMINRLVEVQEWQTNVSRLLIASTISFSTPVGLGQRYDEDPKDILQCKLQEYLYHNYFGKVIALTLVNFIPYAFIL